MSNKRSAGFTIIEIVLVLAIASIIFLIIFLVVPAAQRAARDQQRKSDLGQLVAAIEEWRLNHPGQHIDTPEEMDQLMASFSEYHKEPKTGEPYDYEIRGQGEEHISVLPPIGKIVFTVAHVCGTDSHTPTFVTIDPIKLHYVRIYSVLLKLESSSDVYCLDNDN